MTSINLSKGQTVPVLDKKKQPVIKVVVGLGWDVNVSDGVDFDLDASVSATDEEGVKQELCFFNDKNPVEYLLHTGDNLTGEGEGEDDDGDDEKIRIDLSKVPDKIRQLNVAVHIFDGQDRGQSFGDVKGAHVRLVDANTKDELLKYNISDTTEIATATGLHFASLVRDKETPNGWKFVATGKTGYDTLQHFVDAKIVV